MAWAPDYTDLATLKSYLRISDTVDDVELALYITAASRSIDVSTNRQFGVVASAEARKYVSVYDRHRSLYVINIDDLMTTTGLVVDNEAGTTLASSDYTLEPLNAAQESKPWTQITTSDSEGIFDITGLWGWAAVPDTVEAATLLQAARFFQRRNAPFGVAGSPETGSEVRLLDKLDPDVKVMINTYKRWWVAG